MKITIDHMANPETWIIPVMKAFANMIDDEKFRVSSHYTPPDEANPKFHRGRVIFTSKYLPWRQYVFNFRRESVSIICMAGPLEKEKIRDYKLDPGYTINDEILCLIYSRFLHRELLREFPPATVEYDVENSFLCPLDEAILDYQDPTRYDKLWKN